MIKPTGNKILVKLEKSKAEYENKGGIFLPGTTQSESHEGKIVALGSGNRNSKGQTIPFEVVIGDTILIGKFAGMEIKYNDEKYVLVTEEEILGIVSNE